MTPAEMDLEPQPGRFVVGIDLGTTNSAVCYVDCHQRPWRVHVFPIPQFVAPGQIESRDTLPSFHYQPPVGDPVVGFMARDDGAAAPGRLVSSAKSWLSHKGVDRTADVLPWHPASDVQRISPLDASSRFLSHIRQAWNDRFPSEPLERQDIVLTLPASFDEIARELTVEAAARAGLDRVVLIEEPQAAFYAWIYKHQDDWARLVQPGQKILVCDIGGGTTDFTLIRVRRGESGNVQFHRVAVGDHLLLGGDNMDLALAQHLERKLSPTKLQPRQWDTLLRQSRQVKERMLSHDAPAESTIVLPASGSQLLGSGLSVKATREEVRELLVEGFMPVVSLTEKPLPRRSGFQEFGLPYATDSAITRYLAAFLTAHRHAGDDESEAANPDSAHRGADPARPNVLLFNGGVFESSLLRQRLVECLRDWFPEQPASKSEPPPPAVLDNDRLDLAVARGAAYYGMVRRGEGVKIVASLARTYYVGLDAQVPQALCLVPGNAEPGQTIDLANRQFDLQIAEPVEFPLYISSTRLTDQPGQIFNVDPQEMSALPPIRTVLKTKSRRERGTVAVRLHARLTEIGTMELWCTEIGGERSWRLQFDVRAATQTDVPAHESAAEAQGFLDESVVAVIQQVLAATFGPAGHDDPGTLVKRLIEAANADRHDWPTSLLRRIWELLMQLEAGRRKSPKHEARWLNLLGYCLRPGYGLAVDDWRVAETWKTVQGKLAHAAPSSRTESLILWRRIAGGLNLGQQRALAEPLIAVVRSLHKRYVSGKAVEVALQPHEALEVLRLLGSLELLDVDVKVELAERLLELLPKKKLEPIRAAMLWAVGRLAARQPAYGPLNAVIPPHRATAWIDQLLEAESADAMTQFAVVNAARKTHDRFRDLEDAAARRVYDWLKSHGAGEHALRLVSDGGELEQAEQERIFGEALPKGLRVR